jgi:hypothetical protein
MGIFVRSVMADSNASSRSTVADGRSGIIVDVLGGRGDGLRGPSGRRSDECREVDRLCLSSDVTEVALLCGLEGGDGGRWVFEELVVREVLDRWLCVRLDEALDDDRRDAGGSSKSKDRQPQNRHILNDKPSYMVSSIGSSKKLL